MKLNNNDDSHNSGLNLLIYNMLLDIESHPAWVCGLKLIIGGNYLYTLLSHTLRGCVDWNYFCSPGWCCQLVTPCVGVWIETCWCCLSVLGCSCHTLRGCVDWNGWCAQCMLPLCGSHPAWVCGLKRISNKIAEQTAESHPAWVCGLKQAFRPDFSDVGCHTLRGCVDWNIKGQTLSNLYAVTPCVGVWIETYELRNALDYGTVTPCVGVWIET